MKARGGTTQAQGGQDEGPELSDLLARCLRGDERAFEGLYRQFAPGVYKHLRVLLLSDEEAEDALQQVFSHVFSKLHTFRHQSKFSTWLHGVAVYVTLNSRRSLRRREQALDALGQFATQEEAPSRAGPEERALWAEVAVRTEQLLTQFSPEKRTAFLLYYVEQLELGEVAAQMGTSSATAWARIHRTRDAIIEALERDERLEP